MIGCAGALAILPPRSGTIQLKEAATISLSWSGTARVQRTIYYALFYRDVRRFGERETGMNAWVSRLGCRVQAWQRRRHGLSVLPTPRSSWGMLRRCGENLMLTLPGFLMGVRNFRKAW